MDKINFLAKDSFPASIETLNRLQENTSLVANLALLGGDTYILQGCDELEGKIQPGILVIAGEVVPFIGGAPLEYVAIQETKKELEAFGEKYPEAYINRVATFSGTGKVKWEELKKATTIEELESKINNITGESPGFVKKWSGRIDRLDPIYMLADGRLMKTADYPKLAWYYGVENQESFRLPNLSGRFIVGYDPQDPDYDSIGKDGGKKMVKLTIEEMPKHNHDIQFKDEKWGDNANSRPFPNPAGTAGYSADTTDTGGDQPHENRPPFYTLAYVVKVKY